MTIKTTQPIKIINIGTRIIDMGKVDIDLNDQSDPAIVKYFTDSIRPSFMVLLPGIIQESSAAILRQAVPMINHILPAWHETIMQAVTERKLATVKNEIRTIRM
ncbi:hypothetical protein QAD02_012065 [Eretmocerus hayati]|uniref:Uncharacterized protein n=1 Tax=Eretmocerus hayati TaxID=131215 RepID=A0ACC2P182_9HYME|nr:hypothetical protein QAD02_012065 [Eretmocerus hayati]